MMDLLENIPEDKIVVFMDAYDVLFLNSENIETNFKSYGKNILLSSYKTPSGIHGYVHNKIFPHCDLV